jgi:hypothetical protein
MHQQPAIPAVIYKLLQRCVKLYNHECRAQHVNIGHIIFIENLLTLLDLCFYILYLNNTSKNPREILKKEKIRKNFL